MTVVREPGDTVTVRCPVCGGDGEPSWPTVDVCLTCDGEGSMDASLAEAIHLDDEAYMEDLDRRCP